MSMKKLLVGFLFFFACGIPQNILSQGQEFNVENQIYKVLTLDEWEHAQRVGVIVTELDKKDGFVHLSTATQLNATLSLYFVKEESVMLLQVDQAKIHDGIKYEAPIPPGSRTSSFPHYYGDLNISAISNIWHLNRGAFEIPIEVMLQAEQSAKP
jgi:uncharacterized protein (DUF952 family)